MVQVLREKIEMLQVFAPGKSTLLFQSSSSSSCKRSSPGTRGRDLQHFSPVVTNEAISPPSDENRGRSRERILFSEAACGCHVKDTIKII